MNDPPTSTRKLWLDLISLDVATVSFGVKVDTYIMLLILLLRELCVLPTLRHHHKRDAKPDQRRRLLICWFCRCWYLAAALQFELGDQKCHPSIASVLLRFLTMSGLITWTPPDIQSLEPQGSKAADLLG